MNENKRRIIALVKEEGQQALLEGTEVPKWIEGRTQHKGGSRAPNPLNTMKKSGSRM
jgi:hypothetical protein